MFTTFLKVIELFSNFSIVMKMNMYDDDFATFEAKTEDGKVYSVSIRREDKKDA